MGTRFTELVGCRHPIQQATMGGIAVPELAGAVARSGALGMLCEFDATPAGDRMDRALRLADGGAVGMGFFGHWVEGDLATFELAAAKLRVVEVFWSRPDRSLVDRARAAGAAVVAWQVGSLDEALAAQDAGCDLVVAQGCEGGGHVRGTIPRSQLLEVVVAQVSIPIVAAGGIATPSEVAEALDAGAAGVRVGTRFVATIESAAHPEYVAALVGAQSGEDTVLTTTFSNGWPDAPHRVLTTAMWAAEAFDGDDVGFVIEHGEPTPVPRFGIAPPTRNVGGHIEAMALYAGTGVGTIHEMQPAADVVADLVSHLPQ